MRKLTLHGLPITHGIAEGKALVTSQSFGFTHGVEPTTGEIVDQRHELLGQNLRGKVFVFPYGKGSSTTGLFVLETARCGNAPAAVLNIDTEPVSGAGFIMAEIFYNTVIPVIHHLNQNPVEVINNGDHVKVDADKGIVEVFKEG